jgi:hypothetical protein
MGRRPLIRGRKTGARLAHLIHRIGRTRLYYA